MSATKRQKLAQPWVLLLITCVIVTTLVLIFPRKSSFESPTYLARPDVLSIAYLRVVVRFWPDDHEARLLLAHQLFTLGYLEEAHETLTPLIKLRGTHATRARLMALDISLSQFRTGNDHGNDDHTALQHALNQALEAVIMDHLSVTDLQRLAKLSLELGQPGLATTLYTRLADTDTAHRPAWLAEAARWALATRQPAQASHLYEQATDTAINTKDALTYALLSLDALRAANQEASALQRVRVYLQRFAHSPEGIRELLPRALTLALAMKQPLLARNWGRQILAYTPSSAEAVTRQLNLELAARDLPAALQLAQRMTALRSDDPRQHLQLAQIAEWAGHPTIALSEWLWLARHDPGNNALDRAVLLGRGLHDNQAIIEMLTLRAHTKGLKHNEIIELVNLYEHIGEPEQATSFLRQHVTNTPRDRQAWELLAEVQERHNNLADAIEVWHEIERRFGLTVAASTQQAKLMWRLNQPDKALAVLRNISHRASVKDIAYWQLLGELAWRQESSADILLAYRTLWQNQTPDMLVAERLMIASRDQGNTEEVLTTATTAWAHFRHPRLLLSALDLAVQTAHWEDATRLVTLAEQEPPLFASSQNYWLLRARLANHDKNPQQARSAYQQVLSINPGNSSARAGLLWHFIDNPTDAGKEKVDLAHYLARWQDEAATDETLWSAYAAGLHALDRLEEALPWYERQAHATPRNTAWLLSYADALDQANRKDAAWRLRQHAQTLGGVPKDRPLPPLPPAAMAVHTKTSVVAHLEWRAHNIGTLDITQNNVGVAINPGHTGLEFHVSLRDLDAHPQQLSLTNKNSELDVAVSATLHSPQGQTHLLLGINQRDDHDLPYAKLTHRHTVPTGLSGSRLSAQTSLSINELSEESTALRVGGARDRLATTLFANLTQREYFSATLSGQHYHERKGETLGNGYTTDMEIGTRLRLGTPEWRIRVQGSWSKNRLRNDLPPALAATLPSGADINTVLPDHYAALGAGTTLQRDEPGALMTTLPTSTMTHSYIADAWVGWLWPAQHFAYNLRLGLGTSLFGRDELSLNAVHASSLGGVPGQAWQGLTLRYNRRFD